MYRHIMNNPDGHHVCSNLNCRCPDFKPQPTVQEIIEAGKAAGESVVYIPPGSIDEPPRVQISQKMLDDLAQGKISQNDVRRNLMLSPQTVIEPGDTVTSDLDDRCEDCGHRRLAHLDNNYVGGTGACHHGSGCQCGWFVHDIGNDIVDEQGLTLNQWLVQQGKKMATALDDEIQLIDSSISVDEFETCANCQHARRVHGGVHESDWLNGSCRSGLGCECKSFVHLEDTLGLVIEIDEADMRKFGYNPQSEAGRAAYLRWRAGDGGITVYEEGTGMQSDEFTRIVEEQIARSTSVLIDKAKEYASDTDRMHNFKVAAAIQGITPAQALRGFLAKHTVSIFDMINSGKEYPLEVWNEKITDHINYLLILRALVEDK